MKPIRAWAIMYSDNTFIDASFGGGSLAIFIDKECARIDTLRMPLLPETFNKLKLVQVEIRPIKKSKKRVK